MAYRVVGCAIEVHKHLGPGLMESIYEKCFLIELRLRGISFTNQISVPRDYKGTVFDSDLRLDVLVEDILCVELKAREAVLPVHEAIVFSYMQMLRKPKALMINFHCVNIVKDGLKSLVNDLYAELPDE